MRWVVVIVVASTLGLSPVGAFAQEPVASVDPASGQSSSVRYVGASSSAVVEMERLARRARVGLIAMSAITGVGGLMLGGAAAASKNRQDNAYAGLGLAVVGGSFAVFGAGGMLTTGIILGVRNKKLRDLWESPEDTPRYTLEELERRKRRAAFGLIAPAAVGVAGAAPLAVGIRGCRNEFGQVGGDTRCENLRIAGLTLVLSGFFGLLAESILVGVRKAQVTRRVDELGQQRNRRVQWEPGQWGFVF